LIAMVQLEYILCTNVGINLGLQLLEVHICLNVSGELLVQRIEV